VSNTLAGMVAGGLLGATIGCLAGFLLIPNPSDRHLVATLLGIILFGNGVIAGAVVGGVEDILTGLGKLGPPPAEPRPPTP
jgi:hypothetical protein